MNTDKYTDQVSRLEQENEALRAALRLVREDCENQRGSFTVIRAATEVAVRRALEM